MSCCEKRPRGSPSNNPPGPRMVGNQTQRASIEQKLIILGDYGVGKSSLAIRMFLDRFDEDTSWFSSEGLISKNIAVDKTAFKLSVHDTSGQEKFRSLTYSYYRNASAIIYAYDITNRTSFEGLHSWHGELQMYSQALSNVMLVGTKCDLTAQRAVSTEEGIALAEQLGMPFLEVSAKEGTNTEKVLMMVATACAQSLEAQK
ncbi:Rab subfamily protein of small gtpase [Balamuthia mandrillaris]